MLKFRSVNPTSPEADTNIAVDPKVISMVLEASSIDRRHRPEINAIIYIPSGPLAVREKFSAIIDAIEEANL